MLLTVKEHQLFVHILDWNGEEIKIRDMEQVMGKYLDNVHEVYMLSDDKKQALKFQFIEGTLVIDPSSAPLNEAQRNKYSEVIVVSDGIE